MSGHTLILMFYSLNLDAKAIHTQTIGSYSDVREAEKVGENMVKRFKERHGPHHAIQVDFITVQSPSWTERQINI